MKPPSLITVCRTFLSFSLLVLYVGFLVGKLNPLTINRTENSHEVISHLPLWAGSKHQNTFVMSEEKTDTKLMRFIAQIWDPGQTRLSLNNKTCVSSKNETKCDGTGGRGFMPVCCLRKHRASCSERVSHGGGSLLSAHRLIMLL